MSILCGHCGQRHESIQAVRECSIGNPAIVVEPTTDAAPEGAIVSTNGPEPLSPGFYQTDSDHIYKVVNSQKGHLYAMLMVGTQSGHTWEYAPGVVKNLQPIHRMTLEDAKQFGRVSGNCMVCGRELTNPESIEAGIGPVCAGKW